MPQENLPIENIAALYDERQEAKRKAEADELSRILRTPLADVSDDAGEMERHSPLFFGKGENPTLF